MELCLIQVLREVTLLSLSLEVVKSFQVCHAVASQPSFVFPLLLTETSKMMQDGTRVYLELV